MSKRDGQAVRGAVADARVMEAARTVRSSLRAFAGLEFTALVPAFPRAELDAEGATGWLTAEDAAAVVLALAAWQRANPSRAFEAGLLALKVQDLALALGAQPAQ